MEHSNQPSTDRSDAIAALRAVIEDRMTKPGVDQMARQKMSSIANQIGLQRVFAWNEIDRVVHGIALQISEQQPTPEQWQEIYDILIGDLSFYDAMLGEHLPSHWRDWIKRGLADRAFHLGTNLSVYEGLAAYIRQLGSPDEVQGGFPTGIAPLDQDMGGGLHGLSLVLGDTGVGKTCFLVSAAYSSLLADPACGAIFYSFDLGTSQVIDRFLSRHLDRAIISRLGCADVDGLCRELAQSGARGLLDRVRVLDRTLPRFQLPNVQQQDETEVPCHNAIDMVRQIQETVESKQFGRVILIFDMFQKLVVPSRLSSNSIIADEYRLGEIGKVQNWLRSTFGEGNYCIAMTGELRKGGEGRASHMPTLDDCKGTTRAVYDSDLVLGLGDSHRLDDVASKLSLQVLKGRDGVRRGSHDLQFRHTVSSFAPYQAATPEVHEKQSVLNSSQSPSINGWQE